jgi:hypothetical protein
MKTKHLLSIFLASLTSGNIIGQFTNDVYLNTPICVEFGKQNDPRILGDGHGGAFIAWKDARNGTANPDIYLQHIDSLGYPQWTGSGIAICNDLADQSTPNLCSDMHGGVIIAWSDLRSGLERDVYAQRVSANGEILWTSNGVAIANNIYREHNEKICSDGTGGAYIVWEQFDDALGYWNIATQHLDSNGNRLWDTNGIPVSNVLANRLNPKIQKGKFGGVYLTWQDYRNGIDYDIFAQRIASNGVLLWNSQGLAVAETNGSQINPKIDSDSLSGGIYIAWADKRNLIDYDIYAQRIDSTGNVFWMTNGIAVGADIGNQSAVDILCTSSSNGVMVTWRDGRNGHDDIYIDKISPSGISSWQQNGVLLSSSNFNKLNPNICSDGNGGAIVAWQDSTINDWDVYSQKINSLGQIQWTPGGMVVSSAIEIQSHPKNVPDGNGGSIYVWQDKRANQYDIYCHHLNDQGLGNLTESLNDFEMTVFPNPTAGYVQINSKNRINEIRIYDLVGNVLREEYSDTGMNATLSLNHLPSGMYIVEIQTGNKKARNAILKN